MKYKLEGAHRACSPIDTINRMMPFFEMAGITRVGEITGLDRIGIPVAQCIRPDAVCLVVDSGKGTTPEAAKCSAIMEGFERHIGETAKVETIETSESKLPKCESRFPLYNGAPYNSNMILRWSIARKIISGENTFVPENCIKMIPSHSSQNMMSANFSSNSNGLSSGNTFDEAVCGGLYEVIERDQVTRFFENKDIGHMVDIELIRNNHICGLIDKIKSKGVNVILFDCTGDIGIPTYMAYLYDSERGTSLSRGYAAHLDPVVAQSRSICEAIQGRLVWMAGSRDDITHEKFTSAKKDDTQLAIKNLLDWKPKKLINRDDNSSSSFSDDIKQILKKLDDSSIPEPLIYEFIHPYPCNAVRVMIPTLEGYFNKFTQKGKRSRA